MGETCFHCNEVINMKEQFVRFYNRDHVIDRSFHIKCLANFEIPPKPKKKVKKVIKRWVTIFNEKNCHDGFDANIWLFQPTRDSQIIACVPIEIPFEVEE